MSRGAFCVRMRQIFWNETFSSPEATSESFTSYGNAVKNGHANTSHHHTTAVQSQLQNPLAHHRMQLPTMAENPEINPAVPVQHDSGATKTSGVEIPAELVSLLRIIKTFI